MSSRETSLRTPAQPEWIIEPRNPSILARAHEIWTARYLFNYFAARLIERRVKGSWIRTLRFFLRPILTVVTYTLVFNAVAGIQTGSTPYFLFVIGGLSIWQLFHESLLWSTRSFQMNGNLLRKLYFPRILLPASSLQLDGVGPALLGLPEQLPCGVQLSLMIVPDLGYDPTIGAVINPLRPNL